MYIRINDKDDIAQHDLFFNFLNAKKRKGHQIIKFKIKQNDFEYIESELDLKYIGKNELLLFQTIPIYWISTKTSTLIFQCLDTINFNFLTIDDATGLISKINILDLEEGTDIILYDSNLKDYIIDEVETIVKLIPEKEIICETQDDEILKKLFIQEEQKLSRYILSTKSDEGIIINNFMLI